MSHLWFVLTDYAGVVQYVPYEAVDSVSAVPVGQMSDDGPRTAVVLRNGQALYLNGSVEQVYGSLLTQCNTLGEIFAAASYPPTVTP